MNKVILLVSGVDTPEELAKAMRFVAAQIQALPDEDLKRGVSWSYNSIHATIEPIIPNSNGKDH